MIDYDKLTDQQKADLPGRIMGIIHYQHLLAKGRNEEAVLFN